MSGKLPLGLVAGRGGVASGGGGGGGSPTGAAGGDLGGTYPNPQVATFNSGTAFGDAAAKNTGTVTGTVAAGDDPRLTDSRAPTGSAGGVLAGTYPNPSFAATAGSLPLSRIGSSTYSTVQHLANFALSPGRSSGGAITASGTANAVDVAAGTGFIKATDSDVATILLFDWSASTALSVPSNTTRYIGVQYNAGSPVVVAKTTDTWDLDTEFPLGVVVNESGTRYIANLPWITADNQANIIERFDAMTPIARDNRDGGLVVSNSGTRNVAVTAGTLLGRMSEFTISALDTSSAGSFDAYYRNGSGGFTKQSAQTQWDNTKYDDNSGTLASITATFYANRWWYLMVDGSLALVYGRTQYASLAAALAGNTPPTSLPDRLAKQGLLIGRFIVQASGTTPAATETAFGAIFSGAGVTSFSDLSGTAAVAQGGTGATDAPTARINLDSPATVRSIFGDGSDGDVTISGGTTTLTRPMMYNNLTIASDGILDPAGYPVFVLATFTNNGKLTTAGNGGGNASGTNSATGGSAGGARSATHFGASGAGTAGASGGSGAGSQGSGSTAQANAWVLARGGDGGAAGSGSGGAGGNNKGGSTGGTKGSRNWPWTHVTGITLLTGGTGGTGGSSGGGDGTNNGGGGGGGGSGGQPMAVAARFVVLGATAIIASDGGTGGNGGSPATGNCGGGGPGGGGGAGPQFWIYETWATTAGYAHTAAAGSNGSVGTGHGTGNGGTAPVTSAGASVIVKFNIRTGAVEAA